MPPLGQGVPNPQILVVLWPRILVKYVKNSIFVKKPKTTQYVRLKAPDQPQFRMQKNKGDAAPRAGVPNPQIFVVLWPRIIVRSHVAGDTLWIWDGVSLRALLLLTWFNFRLVMLIVHVVALRRMPQLHGEQGSVSIYLDYLILLLSVDRTS